MKSISPAAVANNQATKLILCSSHDDHVATVALEDSIHNVATNCSTGTENRCIAHLLPELFTVFFKFAWLLALAGDHCTA
jgi:hypothetical protein